MECVYICTHTQNVKSQRSVSYKMASNSLNHGTGVATTISSLHSNIIESHILPKLDGQSLASTASTSHLLHTLCKNENLWEHICNSTWNSIKQPLVQQTISTFPGGYRSFFSDSFPSIHPNPSPERFHGEIHTTELISAVDISYGKDLVHSKVHVTRTDNSSFLESSLCVDLLDDKETAKMPLIYEGDEHKCMKELEENLTLSWILIDPTLKRAANVSSLKAVSMRPHWDGSAIKVTYATILSGDSSSINTTEFVECRVVAIFGYEEGKYIQLRDLSLCVVDMHRGRLSGEKSLSILKMAMESGERKKVNGGEVKKLYAKYVDLKRKRRDDMKRLNMKYTVLDITNCMIWIFFAISLLCSLYVLLS